MDCMKNSGSNSTASTNATSTSVSKYSNAAQALVSYFEQNYQCSGICKTPLFYNSLDLKAGIPTKNCQEAIKKEMNSNVIYLGVTGVVIGVLLWFIWVFQYCLWKKFRDEDH